jgi:hypothetical protein
MKFFTIPLYIICKSCCIKPNGQKAIFTIFTLPMAYKKIIVSIIYVTLFMQTTKATTWQTIANGNWNAGVYNASITNNEGVVNKKVIILK